MSVSCHIIPFDDALSDQHALVGGKAASLGRLSKAGFPVPPGFSISTAAYAAFMAGLHDIVAAILTAADYQHAELLEAQLAQIRALIINTPLPPRDRRCDS